MRTKLSVFTWLDKIGLASARRAARSGRWDEAERAYARYLKRQPLDGRAWVQLGHSCKEQGRLDSATAAYRRAVAVSPRNEDGWIFLADMENRQGSAERAVKTLGDALVSDPLFANVVVKLIAMGRRSRLPLATQRMIEQRDGSYGLARYDHWRAALEWDRVAQASRAWPGVLAVIDARNAGPELIEVTRGDLGAIACLVTDAAGDDRKPGPIGPLAAGITHVLLAEAGTRLAGDALRHLHEALINTGAGAAYADHDHWRQAEDIVWLDPCFQPMPDPVWNAYPDVRPPCVLAAAQAIPADARWADLWDRRMGLPVRYAHVPLILASRPVDVAAALRKVDAHPLPVVAEDRIQVIIQTRDAAGMLEQCVASLIETAARPDRLDIVIVDNRSVMPETAALLAKWSAQGLARIVPHDEPFNWARANNIAAALGDAPYILFLNNDVETRSHHWDHTLRARLSHEAAGVVGALLTYPDGTIQHAGIVFGVDGDGPLHEGIGQSAEPGGPSCRWQRSRQAAAVTGAWMATRRTVFEAVSGFEERLPIGYNDVDFCLRCRAGSYQVIQACEIVAMHHESATRGATLSSQAQARDRADWAWLCARWGESVAADPACNPHWVLVGRPFDAICTPDAPTRARWTAASARPHPWAVPSPIAVGDTGR